MKKMGMMIGGAVALAAAALSTGVIAGDAGVSSDKILLGQSCALKGPASALGKGMRDGLLAYFNQVNANGGINGRQIELQSINDGYEPEKCTVATNALVDKVGVFALIGGVGTPTAKVAAPIAGAKGVPFVAPFTGAGFLRDSENGHVVNFRASYGQEMERLAQYLVDAKGFERIACFYQNDGYGKVGLAGIEAALEKRGMTLVSTGTYERNTVAVASGLDSVAQGNPQAVVMVGAYTGCASFIKAAKGNPATADAVFCNISFVGTEALSNELGAQGKGVIVSQVVPYPWDTSIPVVAEFHRDMKASGFESEIGFISLEGYLAGKMFAQGLATISGEPTREAFLASFASKGSFDLGGVNLEFGAGDNQGLDQVWLTVLTGNGAEPLKDPALAAVDDN